MRLPRNPFVSPALYLQVCYPCTACWSGEHFATETWMWQSSYCFPSLFLPNQWSLWNIILSSKQMSPHWLFFLYTCWAVHFWTSPVPGLSYSHAICCIGWSFWPAVLPLAQCGSSVALWMWGGLAKEARFHYECHIKENCWSVRGSLSTNRLSISSVRKQPE